MHMRTNIYNYWIKFKTFCMQASNGSLELQLAQNPLLLSVPVVILQHFHIIFCIFFLLDKKI